MSLGPGEALAARGWGRLVMLRRSDSAPGLLAAAAPAPILPHRVSVRHVFHSEQGPGCEDGSVPRERVLRSPV